MLWSILITFLLAIQSQRDPAFAQRRIERYTVGVLGDDCYSIMVKKMADRGNDSKIILIKLVENKTVMFFDGIKNNVQMLYDYDIQVIVGRTSTMMIQAAGHSDIPYVAIDSLSEAVIRDENINLMHYYSLTTSEDIYASATLDLLNHFQVQKVSVIIDSTVDYKSFIQPMFDQKSIDIKLWSMSNKETSDITKLPEVIDKILTDSRSENIWDFVVKADNEIVKHILIRAKYYGMLIRPNKWYIPSFMCHDISIAAIRHIFSNITLINEKCTENYLRQPTNYSTTALIDNVIQLFRKVNWSLNARTLFQEFKTGQTRTFTDNGKQIWSLLTIHTLNMDDKQSKSLTLVGMWSMRNMTSRLRYHYANSEYIASKKQRQNHLRVSAVEEHPHLIVSINGTVRGFGVDLIKELCKLLNVSFTISLQNNMGNKESSSWTGIVNEILSDRADISLGPLVHTMEKEEVIDFTTSFKQREISLVIRKPLPSTSLFQFIGPFCIELWFCGLGSLIFVTLSIMFIERIHDKYFPGNCPVKFNLKEASFFTIGSVVKKQLDVFPRSVPGQIIHWTTFFFSVMIITSYTANLAAFLTVQSYPKIIESVEDLSRLPKSSKIKFGTVMNSDIHKFFEESDLEAFRKIYLKMEKHPQWMVNSTSEGYKKALREPYVFIWDDSVNQYEIFSEPDYDCNLIIVGRPFGKRSFAFGVRQNSKYLETINRHLLYLIESGKVENLENKWWTSNSICSSPNVQRMTTPPLYITNVAGIFLILVSGVFASIIWFSCKLKFHRNRKTRRKRQKQENNSKDQQIALSHQRN